MERYYDKWEKTAGTSAEEDPLGPPRTKDYQKQSLKSLPLIKLFNKAMKKLGYHSYQVASCNVSQVYKNPDCETLNQCQYCAFCTQYGCDFGAKSDPIVTVLPTAGKTGNVDFRYDAYARRIL